MSSDNPHVMDISNPGDGLTLIYPYVKRYIHVPLQTPDSIRVLELLPGTPDSALLCRIFAIPRTHADIEFEAISYVWGSSVPACYLCEVESNSWLRITRNLYLALKALRYADRNRIIWADAICINQSDNDEKSHQVGNMGSIYETASMVVVWLGNVDFSESFKSLERPPRASDSDITIAKVEPNGLLDNVMVAVLRIVGTQWFTRLWIIQEFVLARDVQIWAGDQHINYKTLESAMAKRRDEYLRLSMGLLKGPPREHSGSFLGALENYVLAENLIGFRTMWRDQSHPSSGRISLYDCCRIFHQHPPKCTDERDLIYALIGLAKHPTMVVPDYSLTVTNVFLEFTWLEIANGNIDILRDAEFLGNGDLYPSFLYRPGQSSRPTGGHSTPKGAGASRAAVAEAIRPASIQIRGVIVDRISGCWKLLRASGFETEDLTRIMRGTTWSLEDFLLSAEVVSSSDERFASPTNRFYTFDTKKPAQIEARNLLDVYRYTQLCAEQIIGRNQMRKEMIPDRIRDRFWRMITLHRHHAPSDIPKDFRHVPRDYIDDPSYSHLFTTVKGYIGKASRNAKVDDLVVIFDGGDVPFVLRKAYGDIDGQWKLVGECHVDGWMDGSYYGHEVLDDVDQYLAAADAETSTDFSYPKETLLSEYFVLC